MHVDWGMAGPTYAAVPIILGALLACGCAAGGARTDGGALDASGGTDVGRADAPDAGAADTGAADGAGADTGPLDVGVMDGGLPDTGSPDTGPPDTGPPDTGPRDAGPPDTGPPTTPVSYMCVPAVMGNELNSGIVLNSNVWSGFRFEVTGLTTMTTTSMELNMRSATGGTVFAALVRLTDRNDRPDASNLTSPDVLTTKIITVPGGSSSATLSVSVTVALTPGWYAAVFGTGAFATSLTGGTIHSNSGGGGCGSGYGFPFSIRQSDGAFILQGATPHFQVDGLQP